MVSLVIFLNILSIIEKSIILPLWFFISILLAAISSFLLEMILFLRLLITLFIFSSFKHFLSIIYDITSSTIRIGKILYNENMFDIAQYQIKLAIAKIAKDKNIDLSLLDRDTLELYNQINSNNDTKSRS